MINVVDDIRRETSEGRTLLAALDLLGSMLFPVVVEEQDEVQEQQEQQDKRDAVIYRLQELYPELLKGNVCEMCMANRKECADKNRICQTGFETDPPRDDKFSEEWKTGAAKEKCKPDLKIVGSEGPKDKDSGIQKVCKHCGGTIHQARMVEISGKIKVGKAELSANDYRVKGVTLYASLCPSCKQAIALLPDLSEINLEGRR